MPDARFEQRFLDLSGMPELAKPDHCLTGGSVGKSHREVATERWSASVVSKFNLVRTHLVGAGGHGDGARPRHEVNDDGRSVGQSNVCARNEEDDRQREGCGPLAMAGCRSCPTGPSKAGQLPDDRCQTHEHDPERDTVCQRERQDPGEAIGRGAYPQEDRHALADEYSDDKRDDTASPSPRGAFWRARGRGRREHVRR